jgi:hypothetical protein
MARPSFTDEAIAHARELRAEAAKTKIEAQHLRAKARKLLDELARP